MVVCVCYGFKLITTGKLQFLRAQNFRLGHASKFQRSVFRITNRVSFWTSYTYTHMPAKLTVHSFLYVAEVIVMGIIIALVDGTIWFLTTILCVFASIYCPLASFGNTSCVCACVCDLTEVRRQKITDWMDNSITLITATNNICCNL